MKKTVCSEGSPISRRRFVASVSIGAATLAGTGALIGCSDSTGNQRTAGTESINWDEECDVIIIGGGGAGLAAAISAAEKDPEAGIVLLEKMALIGGNSRVSGGNYGAPNTDVQKEQGETDEAFRDDSPDLYYNEKRKLGAYRSDPKLTRVFADNALDGYEWLKGMGVVWGRVGTYEKAVPMPENAQGMHLQSMYNVDFVNGSWIGTMTKGRHHRDGVYNEYDSGGANIMAMSDRAATYSNIDIRTNSAVSEILREGPLFGEVIGVVVGTGDNAKHIKANRGIVLAAGGFSANGAMCTKFDSRLNPDGRNTGVDGVTGDALIAAMDVGADTVNMDYVQIRMQRSGISYSGALLIEKHGTYIDIDPDGNRFWKEMSDVTAFRYARLTEVYERGFSTWWSISDADSLTANDVDAEDLLDSIAEGSTVECATLDDLAKTTGVSAEALQSTIDRYNGFVDAGVDDDFGQESSNLRWKIQTPPYYAVPRTYYRQHTCGGVVITEQAEIVDRHGEVIPRFYAAGESLGGVHGVERNGGCGWTECIVFGRIAGAEVAGLSPA